LFFIPVLCLTLISVLPLYYLCLNKLQFENSQKTVFTAFFVQPAPPVFSTDDFFEFISFRIKTSNGEVKNISWQDLTPEKYEDNFLFYIYLRHTFNTRAYDKRPGSKKMIWREGLKFWICNREKQFQVDPQEKIVSAVYSVSYPFNKSEIKNEVEIVCDE
jgi:hypothetical protein